MIYKNKFTFNGKVFDLHNQQARDECYSPIYYHGTTCCAMGILSAKDYHTVDELKAAVAHIKEDSDSKTFSPQERNGGERSLLCIISPNEERLEKNLKKLNFKFLTKMARRRGYPAGGLKTYILSF